MEDSWENWISHLEMDDENFFNQSHIINSSNDLKAETLQQQVFCPETESHYPYPFSTSESKSASAIVEGTIISTTTIFQSSPSPLPSCTVQNNPAAAIVDLGGATNATSNSSMDKTSFHRIGTLLQNTHSSSSSSQDATGKSPTTFILSFHNSTVEPAIRNSKPYAKHGSALKSLQRTQGNHSLKTRAHQGRTKKVRSSSERTDHIVAERKRRQKLTENFIALSATIPGLKKTDKAYILKEAINYVNQLQERVRDLEKQNEKISADSAIFVKKFKLSINEDPTSFETNFTGYRFTEALPEVVARVLEKNVLIAINCEKQKGIVYKIQTLLTNLHLSIASTSVLQFGASTLKITIVSQMDDEYSMTIDDLVKKLRKDLLKSRDV